MPRSAARQVWRLHCAAPALCCSALVLALSVALAAPAAAVKLKDVPRGDSEASDPPGTLGGSGEAEAEAQTPGREPRRKRAQKPPAQSQRTAQAPQKKQAPRGFAIGLRASTLGAGVELEYPFNHFIHGRLLFNQLDLDRDQKISGIEYAVDLDLQSYGLIVDLHPFAGNLRLSAGAMLNDNHIQASAMTAGARQVRIGGNNYTGSLNLEATFDSFAPYAGIGWGGGNRRGWSFHFDLGALYQRNPQLEVSGMAMRSGINCAFSVNAVGAVTITGSASCPADALQSTLRTDLETEFNEIKDDARDFKWYPVISLGLEYRF